MVEGAGSGVGGKNNPYTPSMFKDDKAGKAVGRWQMQRMDGGEMARGQALTRAPLISSGKGKGGGLTPMMVSTCCNTGRDIGTEAEGVKLSKGRYMTDKETGMQQRGKVGTRSKENYRATDRDGVGARNGHDIYDDGRG